MIYCKKSCPLHNFVTNYCIGLILCMIANLYKKVCRIPKSFLSLKGQGHKLRVFMGPLYDKLKEVVSAA